MAQVTIPDFLLRRLDHSSRNWLLSAVQHDPELAGQLHERVLRKAAAMQSANPEALEEIKQAEQEQVRNLLARLAKEPVSASKAAL